MQYGFMVILFSEPSRSKTDKGGPRCKAAQRPKGSALRRIGPFLSV